MLKNIKKEGLSVLLTLVAAALSAFGLHIFVYPARFAPAGIDGVATMLQEITSLNAGYFSLMINIPLLIIAYFFLKKDTLYIPCYLQSYRHFYWSC